MDNNVSSPQDFETGPSQDEPVKPAQPAQPAQPQPQPAKPQPQSAQPQPAPAPAQPQPAPAPVQPQPAQAQPAPTPALVQQKPAPKPISAQAPGDKGPGKKFLLGCVVSFAVAIIILVIVIFLFIGGPQNEGVNPIAKALGIDPAMFVNTLITMVHFFFGIIAFVTFIMTMVGIFKTSMAKKEDKLAKRRGAMMALVSGVMLIITLFSWAGAYYYLSQRVVERQPESILPPVVTVPAKTLELTAPITIEFDASSAPINKTKFEVVSYEWDFGDGSEGTGAKVTHIYKSKGENQGKYTVTLEIHKLDRKTAGEVVDPYQLLVSIANEKVSASFKATPASGEIPLSVQFDASESSDPDGEIIRYDWDFDGDDSFDDAEDVKVKHVFEKVGTHVVKLRVTDNSNDYSVFEQEITAKATTEPVAVIEVENEVTQFMIGETYVFSAGKSQSPSGKIEKYEWDFGDGTAKENTKTVSHTFKTAGKYEVTLIITDEEKKTGETFMEVKVDSPTKAPKAKITVTPAKDAESPYLEGEVPFEVVFSASESTDEDENIVDYEWDFNGDTVTDALGMTKSKTFEDAGTFNVVLTVTDADRNVAQDSITIKAKEQGINAKLEAAPITGPIPLKVTFDASGSTYPDGDIISYEWDFGDGSNKQLGNSKITHKYSKVGEFEATVTVIASDGEKDESTIKVTPVPIALQACYSSSKTQGEAPMIVIFDASCSEGTITKFLWNFGDGKTSVEVKPTHTFETPGTYTVSLEVTDNNNTINTFEDSIVVTGEITE